LKIDYFWDKVGTRELTCCAGTAAGVVPEEEQPTAVGTIVRLLPIALLLAFSLRAGWFVGCKLCQSFRKRIIFGNMFFDISQLRFDLTIR
jgi:hypothetical protein